MEELAIREAEEIDAKMRELAHRELRYLVDYSFTDYIFGAWHEKLFSTLERVLSGEIKRLMVCLPPRAGKSEICTKFLPAYFLGKHPEKNVVCASHTFEMAEKFSRETKQIMEDEKYKNVFPDFALGDKQTGSDWETSKGGGYYAVGVGGKLTGRGFNLGIIDDPVKDRAEAESMVIREKVWDWYTSTFYTRRQDANAIIILILTRWNTDDLAGRLLEEEAKGGEQWTKLIFPALDDKEQSFFPERFDTPFYVGTRRTIGVRDFSALYQQDPIRSMGQTFKREDFRNFALSDLEKADGVLKKDDFRVGVFVDPAFSTRKGSDDTAIGAIAKHKITKEFYILDLVAGTYLPSDAHTLTLNMAAKWKSAGWNVDFISVEDVSLNKDQQKFIVDFEDEMRRSDKLYTLRAFKPHGKKEDRIKFALEPLFSRHMLYFRADDTANDAWLKLEEQLLKFPVSRKDDLMDLLAQAVEVFKKEGGAPESPAELNRAWAEVECV